MNSFLREKGFFIIDSEHLDRVRSRMFGYYLDENGITTEDMYAGEAAPSSQCGAYVIVRRDGDVITVEQDYYGSWGLYVFEKDGYFALSNSFLYLVDFLKTRYPLSLDTDFADYLLVADLSSVAHQRTMIREIRLLDRNAYVRISVSEKSFADKIVVPQIQKVELDSPEGIAVLDRWYYRWTGMLRSITEQTDNVTADLSGGFDSRLTFMLLLCSGADLGRVNIDSINDDKHTHKEDYEIASQIAEHFGFHLNDESMLHKDRAAYTTEESITLALAVSLGFNKLINNLTSGFYEPRYRITGAAGGTVRGYWNMPVDEFLAMEKARTDSLPENVRGRYADAQDRVLRASIESIARKYKISDMNSSDLPALLNLEERVRNHFGKDAVETWFVHDIKIAPLMDRDLTRVRKGTDSCPDSDLLVSVIMHRYCPELLRFPFDSGRSIAPDTMKTGAEIASRYPMPEIPTSRTGREFTVRGADRSLPMDEKPTSRTGREFVVRGADRSLPMEESQASAIALIQKKYMEIFNTDSFQRDFRLYAGAGIDRVLRKQTMQLRHNPFCNVYSEMAVVRMLRAVWKSRSGHGSEGLCDRPGNITFSPALRIERKIARGEDWARRHLYWRLKKAAFISLRKN